MNVSIRITKGTSQKLFYTIDKPGTLNIGRHSTADIIFREQTVSREHCRLEIDDSSVRLCDMNSRMGTFLNDSPVGQEFVPLSDGDVVGVGPDAGFAVDIVKESPAEETPDEGATLYELPVMDIPFAEAPANEEAPVEEAPAGQPKHICDLCGKEFVPESDDVTVCDQCIDERPAEVLRYMERFRKPEPTVDAPLNLSDYQKKLLLGQGGMGEVWLYTDKNTGQDVAVKFILASILTSDKDQDRPESDMIKRFRREANIGLQLNHPNLLRHIGTGEFEENGETKLFIVEEYCSSGNLKDYLSLMLPRGNGMLELRTAVFIMNQILDGLDYLHKAEIRAEDANGCMHTVHGIVHRDIKPANIFMTSYGYEPQIKIADYGLSKAFELAGLSRMTMTGSFGGTERYMPEQQVMNYRYAKPAVDVWAATAVFYEMLTEHAPKELNFDPKKPEDFTYGLTPIRKRNDRVPQPLADVIDYALVDSPELHELSAAELKRMINDAVKGYC